MKEFTCYDCEETFKAESADETLKLMHPHYMEKHKDVIANAKEEDKKAWMEKFHKDWEGI